MTETDIALSRVQKSAHTKDKIYKAGRDLMRQYGYDGVTVKMITESAQVSVGTFYHFFHSKEDLLNRVSKTANELFSFPEDLNYDSADCKSTIIEFYRGFCDFMEKQGPDYIIEIMGGTRGNKTLVMRNRNYRTYMINILNGFKQAGKIKAECDVDKAEEMMMALLLGIMYQWGVEGGKRKLFDYLASVINTAVEGILA